MAGLSLLLILACDRSADPDTDNTDRENIPPAITSQPQHQATEDSLFTFVVEFGDPDGPDTAIAYYDLASWLTVSHDTVWGRPGDGDTDTSFVVIVSDGLAADTLTVEVTVIGVNDAPVISRTDTSYAAASLYYLYQPDAVDPDNADLIVSFEHTPDWLSSQSDSVYGIPPATADDDSIIVIASDGELADTANVYLRFLPHLAVYGDSRTGHDAHTRVVAQIMAALPAVVFHTGDLVEDGTDPADWDMFNAITGDLRATAEFFPALGNHELQAQLFFDNFELPGNEQWYSVVRNRTHFIILNTCVDISPTSEQYLWLLNDLASVGDSIWFTAVLFHHPPYSTGYHTEDELGLRATLVPLFEQYGVDIVFNGHDHDYERSYCGDIYYIVAGGGGAPLRDQYREHECSQLFLMQYHFCRLSILPDRMYVRVIDDLGVTVDEYELLR